MSFKEIDIKDLNENAVRLISDEWMLISAGDKHKFNMMTASWGFLGQMWSKPCVAVGIRPQRYTLEFVEKNDYFSLSFYGDRKDIHKVCGSKSGRDVDKVSETGLTPMFSDGTVYFEEARLIIICKKLYCSDIREENFTDNSCMRCYPDKDFHRLFFAEIVKVLEKD